MASYKEPLSKNPNNIFSQRFTGAGACKVDDLVQQLLVEAPQILDRSYGFKAMGSRTTVTIGGMFNKKEYPGIAFRFSGHSDYASILVGFNKVGAVLDVDAVLYGGVSKNMQHSNLSKVNSGISLSGFAKQAFHGVMTDTNAVEEEEMHYQGLVDAIAQVVQSWLA